MNNSAVPRRAIFRPGKRRTFSRLSTASHRQTAYPCSRGKTVSRPSPPPINRQRLRKEAPTCNTHCHTNVCQFEGRRVIDSIAGHGGDLAKLAKEPHNVLLVLGLGTGEDSATCPAEHLDLEGKPLQQLGTASSSALRVSSRSVALVALAGREAHPKTV